MTKENNLRFIQEENLKYMNSKFKKCIISSASNIDNITGAYSTGSIQLDNAIGNGGIPYGRIVEIYGNETSGKTTISLHIIKEAIKNNKKALFIDAEHALDINYVKNLGIDPTKLLIASPESGEQTFEIIEEVIKNKMADIIVVDSVAAMVPDIEMSSNIADQQMGAHAKLMSKGLRKIQTLMAGSEISIIFLNQVREKIGVFFGNPETTTGGRALKFFTSIRIETRKAELIKDGVDKIGVKIKATTVKNKVSPPLKTAFIDIYFGKGFDYQQEIIDFGVQQNVIVKNGSWYSYNDQKVAQGKEQLKKYFEANPDQYKKLEKEVIKNI